MTETRTPEELPDIDQLYRFGFGSGQVRGVAVSVDRSWSTAGQGHDYPPAVAQLLGECVAAALVMVATLKFEGRLILQFRGEGPISLLVVQARSDLSYRVTAQWSADLDADALDQSIQVLLGQGQMALTIEPADGVRYQSLVPIEGQRIAEALEGYFRQSEQLPTRLELAADAHRAVGLLIQQIPGEGGTPMVRHGAANDEFAHLSILVDTLDTPAGQAELRTTPVPVLLHRLFHQDALGFTDIRPIRFYCGCSRAGVGNMLRSLGRTELEGALSDSEVPDHVSVRCEFCGQRYNFDAVDVEQILLDTSTEPPDATRH
ncbi:hypothetical protein A9404_05880 [Halothiobacillus diazotrophicus]|uniref:Hsp33 family molecular chaperone HslO n=1 Tax=Halothiobacillus diazotrophicus TaxID=1860122 RepID=A0A191ZGI7_9GAMM|nr:Hsp33 family molecular chaperone HslO [Halothiobacillus diazotrophicus]ANJ66970.1 hypothetical protein A9404_05880 [Halothiobacillus diazotrophicus]